MDPVAPTEADVEVAKESNRRLARFRGGEISLTTREDTHTERIEIPKAALPIIRYVLECMSQGLAISLAPVHTQVTTQQAANLLGVSRPFLIKLLERNEIPFTKVNRHRRIVLKDLLEYKRRSHQERQRVLDELSRLDQGLEID
jgi:excisionase family DNA binding protein